MFSFTVDFGKVCVVLKKCCVFYISPLESFIYYKLLRFWEKMCFSIWLIHPGSACLVSFSHCNLLKTMFSIPNYKCETYILFCFSNWLYFLSNEGGDVVKIAQLANMAGIQSRISQPESPVTLQFQGNKFTLSTSQLRQLTTGQPLQLQGTLGNVHPIVIFLSSHHFFDFSLLSAFTNSMRYICSISFFIWSYIVYGRFRSWLLTLR